MGDVKAIIEALDGYLLKAGRDSIAPPEANHLLNQMGLLCDSKLRPGLPLRILLRAGKLPHAYQEGGKYSRWVIPNSKGK